MKSLKVIVWTALVGILSFSTLTAQQLPLYSQYMFNGYLLNPAIAGADGYTTVSLSAREQWLGMPDAPSTYTLSGQTRILKNSLIFRNRQVRSRHSRRVASGRVGLGGYVFNDRTGIIDRTGMQLTYAYHIPMDGAQLSFGVSANMLQMRIKHSDILLNQESDRLVDGSKMSLFIPDANFGVFLTSSTYYMGFSAAQLMNASIQFGEDAGRNFKMERHYFITAGYTIDIDGDYHIDPSVLIKGSEAKAMQVDLNAKFFYRNDYFGGLSYRTGAQGGSLVFMGGVSVDKFNFGYAYDHSFSSVQSHSYGSHEFMASVRFGDNARRFRYMNRY
jgi:type IX secretion system PorP/SprF family membrane protein